MFLEYIKLFEKLKNIYKTKKYLENLKKHLLKKNVCIIKYIYLAQKIFIEHKRYLENFRNIYVA